MQQKTYFLKVGFLIAAIILLEACSTGNKKQKPTHDIITVSILPQKTFVEKIAGNDFEINVLVPSGASPASYTLLPSQLKEISHSNLWFRIGYIGFEQSWKDKIAEANKSMKVVDLSEGLNLIAEEEEQHGNHVHAGGVDPHIWLSPVLVKQMAQKMVNELTLLKPEKSAEYKINYLKFVKEIDQLNIEIKNKLKPFKGRKIIIFHPSLSYFARDYGIEQFALEEDGKEPSPKHLKEIVDIATREKIKTIYIQDEFDRENARVFANELKGNVVQIRPLDPAWEDNLREITAIFVDNF